MDQAALENLLNTLIATWENEVVEFKGLTSISEIGKYFSALANEANLRSREKAWLIFGVNNKTKTIEGTHYRLDPLELQKLKSELKALEPSVTFRNIHEIFVDGKRVLMLEIPAAPRGIPIAWNGHYYGRAGESIDALGLDKLDEIRQQTLASDWSAQIVPNATFADLDETAIQKARRLFAQKHANRFAAEEMAEWTLQTFLDRAKLTQNGQITRTTLLLLGKAESAYLLSPHPAQMTWKLEGEEQAYEHFSTPFLLTTTQLYQKIRNIQIRLLPAGQLVPHEVSKYDQSIVLEALHNCIAHQDYTRCGRIVVIEKSDKLIFENEGSFYEGKPDDYVLGEKTPHRYRNPFLVQAMVELGMIDTMGYGIHRMHKGQAKRYFPLPDYDPLEANTVRMMIYGGEVDPAYSQMLMQKADLPFEDVLALDRVQKNRPIPDEAINRLRRAKLIEGRKPNFHVSAIVAAATDHKAEYIRTRAQHDAHYQKLILDYLEKHGSASRKDIETLLWKILSEALDDSQKNYKISNLLSNLRRSGKIKNHGSNKIPEWRLAE
ncbi:RNA-binding domain-containing protein [Nitrosomonas sp. sh817]|uniref:RNA-binding domain-containing protein n=1 Tax=Nitrosomonas sp. sh817 TaxID=3070658 RepID=UPI0027DCB4AD|nr:RNA-binding domain-containing protein [Nitrosomonas sp. sh817]WMJ09845.1 putative DNA binding domain-containing protein [Nitrosomonas sp. sh817]